MPKLTTQELQQKYNKLSTDDLRVKYNMPEAEKAEKKLGFMKEIKRDFGERKKLVAESEQRRLSGEQGLLETIWQREQQAIGSMFDVGLSAAKVVTPDAVE